VWTAGGGPGVVYEEGGWRGGDGARATRKLDPSESLGYLPPFTRFLTVFVTVQKRLLCRIVFGVLHMSRLWPS
jgi:hypothetical protein